MASQTIFTCVKCGFSVEAWDDGNPYIEAPDGQRFHFYHPSADGQIEKIVSGILGHAATQVEIHEMLQNQAGNESDYLCLDCGKMSMHDPKKDKRSCANCGSKKLADVNRLGGRPCPSCKEGQFDIGRPGAIS